jgi:hypothetical protein
MCQALFELFLNFFGRTGNMAIKKGFQGMPESTASDKNAGRNGVTPASDKDKNVLMPIITMAMPSVRKAGGRPNIFEHMFVFLSIHTANPHYLQKSELRVLIFTSLTYPTQIKEVSYAYLCKVL